MFDRKEKCTTSIQYYQSRMMGVEHLVESQLTTETELLGVNLLQRHFVYHKPHITLTRSGP
jgi:hypothetical protein